MSEAIRLTRAEVKLRLFVPKELISDEETLRAIECREKDNVQDSDGYQFAHGGLFVPVMIIAKQGTITVEVDAGCPNLHHSMDEFPNGWGGYKVGRGFVDFFEAEMLPELARMLEEFQQTLESGKLETMSRRGDWGAEWTVEQGV